MSLTLKRIGAYILDILFVYLLISLIINIKYINPTYDKYMEAYTKYVEVLQKDKNTDISLKQMQENNKENYYNVIKYGISNNFVVIIVIILYFGIFQKYNNGQTLGKKMVKLRVVSTDDNDISIGRYLLRLLPMYFMFIGGILPILINSILVYFLDCNDYINVNYIVTYIFLLIGIFDVTANLHNRISKTKVQYLEN